MSLMHLISARLLRLRSTHRSDGGESLSHSLQLRSDRSLSLDEIRLFYSERLHM